jgi:predicted transcriptional regulator
MAQLVRDVMTPNPFVLPAAVTWMEVEAVLAMRAFAVGDVLVLDNGQVCGILMDRDLIVCGIANGDYPATAKLAEICRRHLTAWSPPAPAKDAVSYTRHKAFGRFPVLETGQPNGRAALGGLAIAREPQSALGDMSAAPPNRLKRWFPYGPCTPSGPQGDMKYTH